MEDLQQKVERIDDIVGTLVPAVAQGIAVVRIVGSLLRPKMTPDQQKTFDEAIATYDANNAKLQSAIDALRAASSPTSGHVSSSSTSLPPAGPHSEG